MSFLLLRFAVEQKGSLQFAALFGFK